MNHCCYYHFDYFPKGFQVRYERDNISKQYIPFTQIVTFRHEYLCDEKIYVVTLVLKESLKYTYYFKSKEESEKLYDTILQNQ
jgi:hypothetical protein